jgi:uncharacterized RDD family membrane protein YckC
MNKIEARSEVENLLAQIMADSEMRQPAYATFWQRAAARIIDTAIIAGIVWFIQYWAIDFIRSDQNQNEAFILLRVKQAMPAFGLIIWFLLYSPILESLGGTVGKRILRIQLVDEKTMSVPAFRLCSARSWLYMVFVVLLILPAIASCLAVFISPKKQTWHDQIVNVICIQKPKA